MEYSYTKLLRPTSREQFVRNGYRENKNSEKLTKQIPLSSSQWQDALDRGEVDSELIVEFEVIGLHETSTAETPIQEYAAKIIPAKKEERMFTEQDMEQAWRAGSGYVGTFEEWIYEMYPE